MKNYGQQKTLVRLSSTKNHGTSIYLTVLHTHFATSIPAQLPSLGWPWVCGPRRVPPTSRPCRRSAGCRRPGAGPPPGPRCGRRPGATWKSTGPTTWDRGKGRWEKWYLKRNILYIYIYIYYYYIYMCVVFIVYIYNKYIYICILYIYMIKDSWCCLMVTINRCKQYQQLQVGHSSMYGNGEHSSEATMLDIL